ncbi:hypothetical protein [Haloarcula laminariae]|uniref:hypothetical protein n=1 Tax=Haloarcula laminariae TaxID=2961577 RepID=UPI0021C7F73E|nr:hypothetical protein [Halomicroarcula laminariae]
MSRATSDEQRGEPETPADTADPATLKTQLELLEEENDRLRTEYARARQSQYRRTALALGGLGVVSALGGLLFPAAQTVLFALAGTGVFLAVLTHYLTPEQFLPASLGRTIYSALAANEAAMVAELGLRDDRVYVPTDDGVRLFVPQHQEYVVPDAGALADVFVVTSDTDPRGLSLEPTGDGLADEFERAVTGSPGADADSIATQASDALVEQFELVESATTDVNSSGGRLTVAVTGSVYGDITRFDHPASSFLASVTARQLDTSVTAESETTGEDDTCRITLTWDPAEENADSDTPSQDRETSE